MDDLHIQPAPGFWRHVQRYQQDNNATWEDVAKAAHIDAEKANAIAQGKDHPSALQLLRIANLLGVHVSVLLVSDDRPQIPESESDKTEVRRTLELVRAYNRLPDSKTREWAVAFIQEIATGHMPTSIGYAATLNQAAPP